MLTLPRHALLFILLSACSSPIDEHPDAVGDSTQQRDSTRDGGTQRDLKTRPDIRRTQDSNTDLYVPPSEGTLSERYPGDSFPTQETAILFHSDFEKGFQGWDSDTSWSGQPSTYETKSEEANNGTGSFKAAFTQATLKSRGDASVRLLKNIDSPSKKIYYRYYARFAKGTLRPHHWTRVCGYDENCPGGTAGLQPKGDVRFNTRVDINGKNQLFFYTYWHEMRSGRCNDGSATPGCEGDQGNTYYFGNRFKPADQESIVLTEWQCYEFMVKENTIGESDGEQALWLNDKLLGQFIKSRTKGEWLRDNFYTEGEFGTDNQNSTFDGFNFRTDPKIKQRSFELEFYQQQNTFERLSDKADEIAEEQAIYYDDVVIATERIGCRK